MAQAERVKSGIPGLDAMLGGGFVPQSAILVRGAPGTGKTSLGLQFLLAGAAQDEPGLFISFEEFPQSLYRDAASLGWDLKAHEVGGNLQMLFTSPEVLRQSMAVTDSGILRALRENNIRRVVIDSLSHFTQWIDDSTTLRQIYHQVISAFRREGITAMYLSEEMRTDYTRHEKGSLPFITDCLIMLRYLEIDSAIQRAIVVLKMRSSAHDSAIHSYTIGQGGITIGKAMEGKSGLLSGLAKRSIISTVK